MKIIIAGSRSFSDKEFLFKSLDKISENIAITEVVSGTARGADKLGEEWGKSRGITVKQFPADWNYYGKRAGYVRNEEMAKYADGLVAFWDKQSKGTKHMIDLATKYNISVTIVEI